METNEETLPAEVKQWMAFSKQKLEELTALKSLWLKNENVENISVYQANQQAHHDRASSSLVNKDEIKIYVKQIIKQKAGRKSSFETRIRQQNKKFSFGLFPTTTIGSFPQTKELRSKRRAYKNGKISLDEYYQYVQYQIKDAVKFQEAIGLDVLVHGEFERNDMVEYFGELLEGFAFTQHGWVQSYGSRGVKPPVIFGDVSRKGQMSVPWSVYAQTLTQKKMKGMLTGPVTMLKWSFVRDDQPRSNTAFQLARAIGDEVEDLERSGIDIIQIDEAALREGLPLKKKRWEDYLHWAVKAFKVCSQDVEDDTQIHTHMCYSEFNDIIEHIAEMDADVITIETSKSHMELLKAFSGFKYPNQIGPGVYDIHSPRIPSVEEMEQLIEKAANLIPKENVWVNPDCGLKTRKWSEVKPALENMVQAAKKVRDKYT
jgi:5-methyltetrahydropteroyltriglutamate--homocysteine methyltransferase